MSLGLLNNIASIYAQNNLNQTQASLQNTLEQLSSGSRINSGADDAAGLAIANGLQANVSALNQSAQNVSAGIGLLQTADGALSQVTNLLNRAVTLSTEASNGTLNSNQVSAANQEYQNILTEISNIGSTTNYNGNSVFSATAKTVFVSDGTSGGSNSYAENVGTLTTGGVGIAAPGAVTYSGLAATVTTAAGASAAQVTSFAAVPTGGSVGGNFTVSLNGGTAYTYTVTAGSTAAQAQTQLAAEFTANGVAITAGNSSGVLTLTATANNTPFTVTNNNLQGGSAPSTTQGPGVNFAAAGISTLTAANASTVLTSVTSAIADVAYQRGIIGAGVNQLTAADNVASAESVNLTSAESSITSTNYGQAASDLAKYQVLSQTGISALAQANSVQQEVLKLVQ